MKTKLGYLALFTAGVATSSTVTWQVCKKKYSKIAQEEIESVKEAFTDMFLSDSADKSKAKAEEVKEVKEVKKNKELEEDKKIYKKLINSVDYTGYSKDTKEEVKKMKKPPYVIPPEEFGENDEYDTISLTYFADKQLADEENNLIEDIDDCVGYDAFNHFGEYEEDSVCIRNDEKQCDYEILLDERNYVDVIG